MTIISTEENPIKNLTYEQAKDHNNGNGADAHVDRTWLMNDDPGAVVQIENFKAITELSNHNHPVGTVITLGSNLTKGLDRLSGVTDGDGSFLDKASDLINAGMHVVDRAMKNVSARFLHVGLMLLFFLKIQVAYAQVGNSVDPEIEPVEKYEMVCVPEDHNYAEIYYSASLIDLYRIHRHMGLMRQFKIMSFIDTNSDGQFLKGLFFGGKPNAMGLPIPEDRVDEYRRDDGFRKIWFVRSNQWLCGYSYETQEWVNERAERRK